MIYNKPYRKDSGIEITKEAPYMTYPGRKHRRYQMRSMRPRKKARSGEYVQVIGEWDPIRHKLINQKRIIHQTQSSFFRTINYAINR